MMGYDLDMAGFSMRRRLVASGASFFTLFYDALDTNYCFMFF